MGIVFGAGKNSGELGGMPHHRAALVLELEKITKVIFGFLRLFRLFKLFKSGGFELADVTLIDSQREKGAFDLALRGHRECSQSAR